MIVKLTTEKKISMIMEALQSLGCTVLSMDFEKDTLDLSVIVTTDEIEVDFDDDDDEDDEDDEWCSSLDDDEDDEEVCPDFEADRIGRCIHLCPECGKCKVNPNVVNRLLENPRFAEVTYMIDQYLNDTLASGFAAQNQMYSTLSTMLLGTVKTDAAVQAARDVNRLRVPVYQADLTNIQNQFMAAVKEVKKEFGSDISAYQALTREMTANMFTKLTKGQDMRHPHVTPGQVASAITGSVTGLDGVNQKDLENLNAALQQFFESTLTPKESPHAESQQ